jgi:hypothetical protein
MKNHSIAVMLSLLLTVCCVTASEISGFPFQEPVYPTQKNVELLGELAWFLAGLVSIPRKELGRIGRIYRVV